MPISNLNKQKCYIEVDVKDEVPSKETKCYFTMLKNKGESTIMSAHLWNLCDIKGWFEDDESTPPNTWLKPLENRYILTEEELYELIRPLDLLVQLREYKEAFGKDEYYLKLQPQTWDRAIKLIQEYNEHLQSLK